MPKEIEMFQHVKLKDGREGAVIEILGDQEAFDIDIGTSSADWDTIYSIKREDIIDPE